MKLPRHVERAALKLAGVAPAKKAKSGPVGRSEADDLAPLLMLLRAAGHPEPVPEHRFHETRAWRFDYAWVELRVAGEREGGLWRTVVCECGRKRSVFVSRHRGVDGLGEDAEKYNAAAIAGWTVIRFTPPMIRSGQAFAALHDALTARTQQRNVA